MKYFLTYLALGLAFVAGAQHMPYNPDANADLFIGVDDVLGILGLYDTPLMQPELTCDYEGTEFEVFVLGAINGDIIIDSVYVEYLIYDTLTYYTPGCPDLVVEPIVLERGYMIEGPPSDLDTWYSFGVRWYISENIFGFPRALYIDYFEDENTFEMRLIDEEIGFVMPSFQTWSYWALSSDDATSLISLPFPGEWHLDENGIQINWRADHWANMCEEFRVIPFWHTAE